MRAIDLATTTPWLITESSLRSILEIAARENLSIEAVEAQLGRRLDNTETTTIRDGVAIIPMTGPIFRYANLFSRVSGATSTEVLARDYHEALANPAVRAILFHVDSPGGEATGIHELANAIAAGRGQKPIVAYVEGLGASAAYWLASAADEIVVDATAALGSIGVVMTLAARDKAAAREIEIVSSQSPNKRPDVTTERGRGQIQTIVDAMADVFVSSVAANRGVTTETVLADFGQGGLFVGQAAVTQGLADRLGSFEGVVAELAQSTAQTTTRRYAQEEKTPMADFKTMFKAMFAAMDETEQPAEDVEDTATEDTTARAAATAGADATANLTRLSADNARLTRELATATAALAEAQTRIAALDTAARTARFDALINGANGTATGPSWMGDAAQHQTMLTLLADAGGEDSPAFAGYVAQQRAVAAQVAASPLLKEIGVDASADTAGSSAWGQLEARAKAHAAANSVPFADALTAVADQDPALYTRYRSEQRGGKK